MNEIIAAIDALEKSPRRDRVLWLSAVIALPIIAVAGVMRLFHAGAPEPLPELLVAATTVLVCGILCHIAVEFPRSALLVVRRGHVR